VRFQPVSLTNREHEDSALTAKAYATRIGLPGSYV
jgi:hypothetical protein